MMEESRNPSEALLAGNFDGIDRLCERCRTLDLSLKNILFLQLKSDPRSADGSSNPIVLREWWSSELKQNAAACEICRFFLKMAVTHKEDFISYGIHVCEVSSTSDPLRGKIFAPCIGFDGLIYDYHSQEYHWLDLDLIGYYYSAPNLSEEVLLPQKLVPERANLEKIKRWFENCRQSHEGSCLEPVHEGANIIDQPGLSPYQHKTTDISVIDCSSRKIVPYNPYLGNYATLSYVWGTESGLPADFVPDCLPNHVPKTIQDALTVCNILEIPFLWVDRYCIPQNDTKERLRQISIMDEIYYNSTLTIIAAAGDNPEHGLPGINGTPRTAEFRSLAFGQDVLVHLANDLFVKEIQKSTWNSRAWTYQEGVVSRKRLVFSESQVHFECPKDNLWEAIDIPSTGIRLTADASWSISGSTCFDHKIAAENRVFPPLNSKYSFSSCLDEFFGRKISYPSDTINAIAGVISWFDKRQSRIWTLSGLVMDQQQREKKYPVDWYEYSFLNALYWEHTALIERHPELPSWTWAGWHRDRLSSTSLRQREVFIPAIVVGGSDKYICMQQVKAAVVSESSLNSITWLSIKDLKPQLCNPRLYADYLFFDAWTLLAKILDFNCYDPERAELRISVPNTWNSSEISLNGHKACLSKSEMEILGIGAEVLIMPLYVGIGYGDFPHDLYWEGVPYSPALILKSTGATIDLGVETPSGSALPMYERIGTLQLIYTTKVGNVHEAPVPGGGGLKYWTWEYFQKVSGMYFEKKAFILA